MRLADGSGEPIVHGEAVTTVGARAGRQADLILTPTRLVYQVAMLERRGGMFGIIQSLTGVRTYVTTVAHSLPRATVAAELLGPHHARISTVDGDPVFECSPRDAPALVALVARWTGGDDLVSPTLPAAKLVKGPNT
ncbi:MAG TPA: hypothetical protein VGM88_09835 [Kofleriaceae bacterium]|jgi:hypothetical protein